MKKASSFTSIAAGSTAVAGQQQATRPVKGQAATQLADGLLLHQNHQAAKIGRRYSFDDNGGGYQGL